MKARDRCICEAMCHQYIVYYIQFYFLLAEVTIPGVLVHGLNTEMIVSLLAAGVCRLDLQLIRSIDELGETFLRMERKGKDISRRREGDR